MSEKPPFLSSNSNEKISSHKNNKPSKKGSVFLKNLKHLPRLLSKGEKKFLFSLLLVIILSFSYLGITRAGYTVEFDPQEGGRYIEGVVGEPEFVNPLYSQAKDVDQDISSLIFSGLMKYGQNQELVPDLAERYEVSEDRKNFTFYLRENLFWHDGEKLTADDVVFTVHTIKNPAVKSPLLQSFAGVAIEKLDERTVKFTLTNETYSPFLKENVTFGILPKHLWEEVPPETMNLSELNLKPVGSGPFKFKEYQKDKKSGSLIKYTLERNNDYYGEKAYLELITFNLYMDWDTALEAYKEGETLGISFIPEESKQYIDEKFEREINYFRLKLPRYYAIFFNWDNNELLKERNVRRAIAHLVDKERIITEALDNEAIPVNTAILETFPGHNSETMKYEFSIEKAKEELEKGNWKFNEEENAYYKDDVKLEFTLTVSSQESFLKVAEIIRENLEKGGITCHIEAIDSTTLQSEVIVPRSYETLIYGQLLMHDPDPYFFWHSTNRKDPGSNLTSYSNPTVDDLLETARKTVDENERAKKYQHFQNILAEELPAIFLYSPTYLYSVSKKVHDVSPEVITLPPDRFAGISSWYLKTSPKIVKK